MERVDAASLVTDLVAYEVPVAQGRPSAAARWAG